MFSLLNTLLSYYRLDAGKEQSENAPFKLKALVDILDSEFSPLAENKGLTFVGGHHGDDVVVMGDPKRITNNQCKIKRIPDNQTVIRDFYFIPIHFSPRI